MVKIAVVGPESTGKSQMSTFLSEKLNTHCVPEYARYYCENLNNTYTLQDEINMFYGQVALEKAITEQIKNGIVICDTTILTIKIWCDHLFGTTPQFVIDNIKLMHYDLYLLMDIDLPWQDDPLRDFPNDRQHFMDVWKKELDSLNANYTVISGTGEARFNNGLKVVQEFLGEKGSVD